MQPGRLRSANHRYNEPMRTSEPVHSGKVGWTLFKQIGLLPSICSCSVGRTDITDSFCNIHSRYASFRDLTSRPSPSRDSGAFYRSMPKQLAASARRTGCTCPT